MTVNAFAQRVGSPARRFPGRNRPASGGRIGAAVRNAIDAAAVHLSKAPDTPARPTNPRERRPRGGDTPHESTVGLAYCDWTAVRKWEDDGGRVEGAGNRAPERPQRAPAVKRMREPCLVTRRE